MEITRFPAGLTLHEGEISIVDSLSGREEKWVPLEHITKNLKKWRRYALDPHSKPTEKEDFLSLPLHYQDVAHDKRGWFSKEKMPPTFGPLDAPLGKNNENIEVQTLMKEARAALLVWSEQAGVELDQALIQKVFPDTSVLHTSKKAWILEKTDAPEKSFKEDLESGRRWIVDIMIPAFFEYFASEFRDIHKLEEIRGKTPMCERQAWDLLLLELNQAAMRWYRADRSSDDLLSFFRVVNNFWCLERGMFLTMNIVNSKYHDSIDKTEMNGKMLIERLEEQRLIEFDTGTVRLLTATAVKPPYEEFTRDNTFDPILNSVLIYNEKLQESGWYTKSDHFPHPERNRIIDELHARYPTDVHRFNVRKQHVEIEEVRHAMDYFRLDITDGQSMSPGDAPVRINKHLHEKSAVHQVASALSEMSSEQAVRLYLSIHEFSGQLTPIGVGQDPVWMLRLCQIYLLHLTFKPGGDIQNLRTMLETGDQHEIAWIFITLLLSEKKGLSLANLHIDNVYDIKNLVQNLEVICSLPISEIRLLAKAVYADNFRYPIDEKPFAEILPDGSLRPREGGI